MADEFDLARAAVRRSFARAVDTYDAAAALQREVLARLLERLDASPATPAVVLDAGSGTGVGARALADRYQRAQVVALDQAEPMALRSRKRGRWLRPLPAICADAQRLPLRDASVDLVFSNLMLQWLGAPDAVFREFLRVLRPGGRLLFTTFGPATLAELRDAWAAADDRVHVNRFIDLHDVGDALLRTGFRDPVMDAERMTLTYRDTMALMRDLQAMGAHNVNEGRPHGLTGPRRLRAMQAAYEARRTDGLLPATWEVVYGHAFAPPAGTALPTQAPGEARVSAASIAVRKR